MYWLFVADMNTLRPLLDKWKDVVVVYMLRLAIAPCVESIILLDRLFYLEEYGTAHCTCVAYSMHACVLYARVCVTCMYMCCILYVCVLYVLMQHRVLIIPHHRIQCHINATV